MNWRLTGGLIALIIVLAVLGPEGTAQFITGLGSWLGKFINAL